MPSRSGGLPWENQQQQQEEEEQQQQQQLQQQQEGALMMRAGSRLCSPAAGALRPRGSTPGDSSGWMLLKLWPHPEE